MYTVKFWAAAAERALKTFAQTIVALIGANLVSVTDLDWAQFIGIGGTAAIVSVLTSVASAPLGNNGPSLADEELLPPPAA